MCKISNLKEYNNNVLLSSTISKQEGFRYYHVDMESLIKQNYICDFSIDIPLFPENNLENIGEYLVRRYRNIMVFANSIKDGKALCKIMNELMPNSTQYLDSKTSSRDTENIISKFDANEVPFLISLYTLREGFYSPLTQGVCLIGIPSHKVNLINMIGTAQQTHHNKTVAKVILTSIRDEDYISKYIELLISSNERIKTSIKKNGQESRYLNFSIHEGVDTEHNIDIKEIEKKKDNLFKSTWFSKQKIKEWKEKFDELKVEIKNNNNLRKSSTELKRWFCNQQKCYQSRSNLMNNDEIYNMWTKFLEEPHIQNILQQQIKDAKDFKHKAKTTIPKVCDSCGAKHRNRKQNLCNDCGKTRCYLCNSLKWKNECNTIDCQYCGKDLNMGFYCEDERFFCH